MFSGLSEEMQGKIEFTSGNKKAHYLTFYAQDKVRKQTSKIPSFTFSFIPYNMSNFYHLI
jgi:hypothetical protein